jgi:hypothetical protein
MCTLSRGTCADFHYRNLAPGFFSLPDLLATCQHGIDTMVNLVASVAHIVSNLSAIFIYA